MLSIATLCAFLSLLLLPFLGVEAWICPYNRQSNHRHSAASSAVWSNTRLYMAKSKAQSKQAALREKLAQAIQQKNLNNGDASSTTPSLTPDQIREQNDRLRFEQLLRTKGAMSWNDSAGDGYLTKQQEEEEINASIMGVNRIFEGDPAPTECFQELVSIRSENAIGTKTASELIPWQRKNPHRHDDYLIVFCDPRFQSVELRATVKGFVTELSSDILKRLVIINADSPAENRRWLKKDGLDDKIEVYSDEKMEFMRAYTALGDKRWSMSMFIISDKLVQKVAREVDQYGAPKTIRYAVKSLSEKRL